MRRMTLGRWSRRGGGKGMAGNVVAGEGTVSFWGVDLGLVYAR